LTPVYRIFTSCKQSLSKKVFQEIGSRAGVQRSSISFIVKSRVLIQLKAAVRWKVPALLSTIRSLKEARENRNQAIKSFKNRLYAEFDVDRGVWLRAVRVLSELDCLFSLAKSSVALGEPMCRPEFVEGDSAFVEFKDLRHPALCASERLKGDFIPNNAKLGENGRIALLTGKPFI
jgi:DNA mismatch repair protein MSH6